MKITYKYKQNLCDKITDNPLFNNIFNSYWEIDVGNCLSSDLIVLREFLKLNISVSPQSNKKYDINIISIDNPNIDFDTIVNQIENIDTIFADLYDNTSHNALLIKNDKLKIDSENYLIGFDITIHCDDLKSDHKFILIFNDSNYIETIMKIRSLTNITKILVSRIIYSPINPESFIYVPNIIGHLHFIDKEQNCCWVIIKRWCFTFVDKSLDSILNTPQSDNDDIYELILKDIFQKDEESE